MSNSSDFKQTAIVKYNPSEYVMDSGWNRLLIGGIIMFTIVVVILIGAKISIKKILKKAYDNEKGN